MCGIAGIVSNNGRPVAIEELRDMCAALVHRGPDDEGYALGTGAGLGMRRLAIIDLHTGHQPIPNEDGTVWVVLNGEIYNFQQLRRDLEALGHSFRTASDTETIVHLYEDYGPRCVDHLRGMFAFAVWDERRRCLLLARDRLGIKPLYYTEAAGRVLFASEVKALLQIADVQRRLNWGAVGHLCAFMSTPPAESIVEGVRKLEPGHVLLIEPGKPLVPQRYWNVQFQPDEARSEDDWVESLREQLTESVMLHRVSDVPLGAFLSGGIDSSSVVATMARLTSSRVKTFSIGFSEVDYDESRYARLVAEHCGTEHHELILEPNVLDILEDLAWFLDEPFGDPSAIPTYMVSKLAAEQVTVVLSGDGGDELFGGYDKYRVEQRERRLRFLPPMVRQTLGRIAARMPDGFRGRNLLRHLALPYPERYLDASTLFRRGEQRRLFQREVWALVSEHDPWHDPSLVLSRTNGDWLSELQALDLKHYLPLDILTKVDRMSMAHSLESRVPLLDHKLVEFAATIPLRLRLNGNRTKVLFKRAMRGILPDAIIDRPKHGFAVPLGRWFRGQLSHVVRELLLSDRSVQRGIFDKAFIERLIRRHEQGRPLDLQLWTLISFELWCRAFLDTPTKQPVNTGMKARISRRS